MPTTASRSTSVRVLLTAFVAAGALLVAGCGSDTKTSDSTPTTTGSTSAAATSGPPAATSVTVTVDDMKFSPAAITVKAGDTVTWKFEDRVPHSVQGIGDAAMGINSPIFTSGEWSHTFTVPGTYRYLCPLHPQMKGTVTVE
ncbi:cupredoxin family copper-binding protein [Nocardia uniformis]|uniref:Cupredoxin family copper-binding protein n=1 Tax=Nocardia uniformis TaxID=53432 RepID=A0A849CF23_9NOCA|nr:cupredoxin family copper-binding protein [Nocardia uniformis]NNH71951.1 cupredoxin family copper-binding protein [Nocardia uniformis]